MDNEHETGAQSPEQLSYGMLKELIERIGDGMLILNEQGLIVYSNSSAVHLFGRRTIEELIGEQFGFPVSRDQRTEIEVIKGGEEMVVEMSFMDFVWEQRPAILVTLHDITHHRELERSLKLARDAAESADRTKSEFLANMSHEMRTPLSGILGMSNLISMTDLSEEQKEYLELLNESARSLQQIINDLLDLSRIEAGQLEIKEIPFSLKRVLDTLLTPLNLTANRKSIRLRYDIDPDVPDNLTGDVGRLKQILNNLLSNALKFTESGSITINVTREPISTEEEKVKLKFAVTDTGAGIPKDRVNDVFHRFMQVDGSSSRKHQGTGLGLSIAQHLAHMLGGDIWVESHEGEGSTFTFTVLLKLGGLRENKNTSSSRTSSRKTRPSLSGIRILLADDNATFRKYLTVALSRAGVHIQTAENGLEAWDLVQREYFDLLLLDYSMPGMDGQKLMGRIRDELNGPTRHTVPIIALTAHALKGDRDRFLNMGMSEYISKPLDINLLLETMESLMEKREPRSQ